MNYEVNDKFCCIDRRLYIPQQWTNDRERCKKAGISEKYQFRTKTQMALDMIKDIYENGLPFGQATGDSVYGADSRIQKYLEGRIKNIFLQYRGKSMCGLDADNTR